MQRRDISQNPVAGEGELLIPIELRRYLDRSGRVVIWPAKQAIRRLVYTYLTALFQPGQIYSEKEVNQLLRSYLVANDYVTVRRDLCDLRYLQRERDGSRYWRAENSEKDQV